MPINFRGLNITFVSFGAVTSDDLFCDKEQAIFDFYEVAGKANRYRRVLDIGANIGVHSILMARQGWEVRAFEPDPEHCIEFTRNVRSRHGNITCFQRAVSDREGKQTFVRVKGNTTGNHLKGDKQPYGEVEEFEVFVVDCRPLFDWADFAKIDCEGHEAKLLLTITQQQAQTIDFMVEVGNKKNAELIYLHFVKLPVKLWSQKNDWRQIERFEDMPIHHSEGSLFIGREPPWPKNS